MIRFFDLTLSAVGLVILFPFMMFLFIVGVFDTGKPLFFQKRAGKLQKPFTLVKFRTMKTNAESTASHLLDSALITYYGKILRRSKLDELPQLWNVFKGDMSLVGPRPCLFCQKELMEERSKLNVHLVRPGITGLSQLSGIDMSTPILLAETDFKMIQTLNVKNYFYYIFLTALGKGSGDRVKSNQNKT